uniref:ribosomal protein L3 n=1 Tax=Pseudoerythrocladia kornmannii TaxID=753682 RepID=UPI001BF106F6|nr:ribosomal protein L3 [Pseudoerythrocladia kornmannii]QUE28260.1 ribosomal protein L3 [Pseudoerythrocladia kornmannii]UNJ16764.1 ribosomal protein L3 [Pseudoerythrocladia kornmannii]
MTQIFDENGLVVPVTIIQAGPCIVTQIKNIEVHGYTAVQVGFKEVTEKQLPKPNIGHLKKAGVSPLKYLTETKIKNTEDFTLGQILTVSNFQLGGKVKISGKSIGRGFTGNQKRHNFTRGPMSHGSKNHRQPGSIGAGTTPGRVIPGKKMAGQMGNKKVSIKNLQIVHIDEENNLLVLKGSVPGKTGNLLKIYST